MQYDKQTGGKLVIIRDTVEKNQEMYKQSKSKSDKLFDIYRMKKRERHLHMVEEMYKRHYKPQISDTKLHFNTIDEFEKKVIEWNKKNPNYFDQLYEEEMITQKCQIYITPNDKYLVHPDALDELTDEQLLNVETEQEMIEAYGYDYKQYQKQLNQKLIKSTT